MGSGSNLYVSQRESWFTVAVSGTVLAEDIQWPRGLFAVGKRCTCLFIDTANGLSDPGTATVLFGVTLLGRQKLTTAPVARRVLQELLVCATGNCLRSCLARSSGRAPQRHDRRHQVQSLYRAELDKLDKTSRSKMTLVRLQMQLDTLKS